VKLNLHAEILGTFGTIWHTAVISYSSGTQIHTECKDFFPTADFRVILALNARLLVARLLSALTVNLILTDFGKWYVASLPYKCSCPAFKFAFDYR
jgi:hypothetical protein